MGEGLRKPDGGCPYRILSNHVRHIGLNRALGYGLRYVDGFRFTHLGYIGAQPEEFDGRRRQR
ncbi:DUF4260 family protein [Lautropia mirabilis ATCC 51599]|uniref:DUF4260 family protein n=1 Tax=Lautropia mirabilis TaxID=47671 RepID=UPI0009FE3F95|nr:DUF4260 family protein [Lautropia mirabilis]